MASLDSDDILSFLDGDVKVPDTRTTPPSSPARTFKRLKKKTAKAAAVEVKDKDKDNDNDNDNNNNSDDGGSDKAVTGRIQKSKRKQPSGQDFIDMEAQDEIGSDVDEDERKELQTLAAANGGDANALADKSGEDDAENFYATHTDEQILEELSDDERKWHQNNVVERGDDVSSDEGKESRKLRRRAVEDSMVADVSQGRLSKQIQARPMGAIASGYTEMVDHLSSGREVPSIADDESLRPLARDQRAMCRALVEWAVCNTTSCAHNPLAGSKWISRLERSLDELDRMAGNVIYEQNPPRLGGYKSWKQLMIPVARLHHLILFEHFPDRTEKLPAGSDTKPILSLASEWVKACKVTAETHDWCSGERIMPGSPAFRVIHAAGEVEPLLLTAKSMEHLQKFVRLYAWQPLLKIAARSVFRDTEALMGLVQNPKRKKDKENNRQILKFSRLANILCTDYAFVEVVRSIMLACYAIDTAARIYAQITKTQYDPIFEHNSPSRPPAPSPVTIKMEPQPTSETQKPVVPSQAPVSEETMQIDISSAFM